MIVISIAQNSVYSPSTNALHQAAEVLLQGSVAYDFS
jgi:hypothetical protein